MKPLIVVGLLVLACCSTYLPEQALITDKVQTAEAAIIIAKEACNARAGDTDGKWQATLRQGIWHVEHQYSAGDPKCNWERSNVWADNGKADGCEMCVVAT
jgi:hypothetical protein